MGRTRFALPVAVIGMTAASLAMAGQPAHNQSSPSRTASSSCTNASTRPTREVLGNLTGEWQGQVEVRRNEKVSVSVISASNRFDKDGNFVCAFSGFAFGRPYDGGIMFQVDEDGMPFAYASTQDFGVEGMRGTFNIGPDGSVVAIGQPTENTRSNVRTIGQVTSFNGPDQYTTEWFEVAPNGEKSSIVKMTFDRLGRNEQADASALFQDNGFQNWNQRVKVRSAKTAEATE